MAQSGSIDAETIAAVQSAVETRMESQRIPGASVALIDNGQVVFASGFGRADSNGRPMTPETPSGLGSLSKSFTAIAIMQLVEDGRVGLDEPSAAYLPELREARDGRVPAITVGQLLGHTSGFSTYQGNFGQADFTQRPDALDRAIERLLGFQLVSAPGETFEYSNANYQILGLMIERLDQRSYEASIQERILDRIGMGDSFVLAPSADDPVPAKPFWYWTILPIQFDEPTPRTIVSQGGVYASARDLGAYLIDLMSEEPRLLSPSSRDELFALSDAQNMSGYGLGWFVERENNRTIVTHGGLNPGQETNAGFVPEQGIGFVVLANAGSGFAFGNVAGLTDSVMAIVLDRPLPPESPPTMSRALAVVLLVAVIGLLAGLIRSILRTLRGRTVPLRRPLKATDISLRVAAPSLGLLAVGWLFYLTLPRVFGLPLQGLRAFAPDAGWGLTIAAYAAFAWAVLRIPGFFWTARR